MDLCSPLVKDLKNRDDYDFIYNSYLQPGGSDFDMEDQDLPGDNDVETASYYNECSAIKKTIANAKQEMKLLLIIISQPISGILNMILEILVEILQISLVMDHIMMTLVTPMNFIWL